MLRNPVYKNSLFFKFFIGEKGGIIISVPIIFSGSDTSCYSFAADNIFLLNLISLEVSIGNCYGILLNRTGLCNCIQSIPRNIQTHFAGSLFLYSKNCGCIRSFVSSRWSGQVSGFPADEPAVQAVDGLVLQVQVTIQHDSLWGWIR